MTKEDAAGGQMRDSRGPMQAASSEMRLVCPDNRGRRAVFLSAHVGPIAY